MTTKTANTAQQIKNVLNSMPYGGTVAYSTNGIVDYNDDTPTLNEEHLLKWLTSLQAQLRGVAERHSRDEAELYRLRSQRTAIRNFLGVNE